MVFVSSFGYYFEELSYAEKMSFSKRSSTVLLAAMILLILVPSWVSAQQRQLWPPVVLRGQAQPLPPGQQVAAGAGVPRVAGFFCGGTPPAPVGPGTQQQCMQTFNTLSVAKTVQNFCLSVGTFCTVTHLILCPLPATVTACRTCMPQFRRLCPQPQG